MIAACCRSASYTTRMNLPLHLVSFQLGRIGHLQQESIPNLFQIIPILACYCFGNPSTNIDHSHRLAVSRSFYHSILFRFRIDFQLKEFFFRLSKLMMAGSLLFCEILKFEFGKYFSKALQIFDRATFQAKDAYQRSILFFCRRHHKLEFTRINIHKQILLYLRLSNVIFTPLWCLLAQAVHVSHNLCKLCSRVLLSHLGFL